jgi:hypothetical protein
MFNIKIDWCIILHHLLFLVCSYLLLFRCYGNQLWFFNSLSGGGSRDVPPFLTLFRGGGPQSIPPFYVIPASVFAV